MGHNKSNALVHPQDQGPLLVQNPFNTYSYFTMQEKGLWKISISTDHSSFDQIAKAIAENKTHGTHIYITKGWQSRQTETDRTDRVVIKDGSTQTHPGSTQTQSDQKHFGIFF